MVALNFKQQFATDVETGKKRQTVRERTKAYRGCNLQLYTGMRQKGCRKLKDVVCVSTEPIVLMSTLVQPAGNTAIMGMHLDEFARADGFKTYDHMWAFFEERADQHGEFHGVLIRW